jgi:hypothetical protein
VKLRIWLLIASLLSLPLGCAIRKDLETPFNNPSNKPVVEVPDDATHGTPFCSPNANGKFDAQTIQMKSGMGAGGVAWADGGGCVMRPIREVWAALQNLEAMKWDDADSLNFERVDHPNGDFTHLYSITYYKSTIIGNIEWMIEWFHGFDQGTFDAPLRVNISYQRVKGTSNIPVWQGGITLSRVKNGVTSIGIHNEFKARQGNSENVQSAQDAVAEVTRKARAVAPDWARLNTGFRDNPSEPDKPIPASGDNPIETGICVKGTDGKYAATVNFTFGTNNDVAWIKWQGCVNITSASLLSAVQNHAAIKWRNAEKVQSTIVNASEQAVQYRISHWFKPDTVWTMIWDYSLIKTAFQITPATREFPAWSGAFTFNEVEPAVTELSLEMQLQTETISDSLNQAKTLAQGLITDLTNSAH